MPPTRVQRCPAERTCLAGDEVNFHLKGRAIDAANQPIRQFRRLLIPSVEQLPSVRFVGQWLELAGIEGQVHVERADVPLLGKASSGTQPPTTATLSRSLASIVRTSIRTDLQALTSFIRPLPVSARSPGGLLRAGVAVPFPEFLAQPPRPDPPALSSPGKAGVERRPSRRRIPWHR